MDQLQALRVFARVVEAGTFTKAADSLQMPKATVSKLVQSLEAHLRVKLLNRTTRQVTVTAEGAAYYERTSRLLAELEEVDSSLANAQALPKGRIRVDVPASFARQIIIPALCAFHKRYPDIQIDLGVGDRLVDLVADNVDCVIRGGAVRDDSLIARRLGQLEFITCAAPAYIERRGLPAHPADLERGHLVVAYFSANGGAPFPLDFTRDGERIEIHGRYVLAVNDSNAYLAAGLASHGIFQLPAFMAREHLAKGELVQVLREWTSDAIPVHAVYPPNRRLSAKIRVFVDWMAELFSALDDLPQP
jgi:LysR family transcriptional regulator, regulator for bpeEF and oprC